MSGCCWWSIDRRTPAVSVWAGCSSARSGSRVSAVPSWWWLWCWCSRWGHPWCAHPETWSCRPSPHNPHQRKSTLSIFDLLKSMMASLVSVVFRMRLISVHHPDSRSTLSQYADSSPPEMSPTIVVMSTNFMILLLGCVEGVEQGAQHAVLRRASAEAGGCRDVVANSHPLVAIRQEALQLSGTWLEGCISFSKQSLHLFSHPGLSVWIDLDVPVHSGDVSPKRVVRCCYRTLTQVILFKHIPVCCFEAVLWLLGWTFGSGFNSSPCGGSSFPKRGVWPY